MAGTESTFNTNTNRMDTRDTVDSGDVAKATASFDPRTTTTSQGEGAPKRDQFGAGLSGDADYSKAVRRYQKLKAEGQSKALGDMK